MNLKIKNWGNSKALIIPKEIVDELNLEVGDELNAAVVFDKMFLIKDDK